MLFSEIRDEVIVEVGGDTSDTDLQSRIFQFIRSSLRRFPRHTRSRMVLGEKTGTLTASTQSMSRPSGLVQEREVFYIDENSNRNKVYRLERGDFNRHYNSNTTGKPSYYNFNGSVFEFDIKSDETRTIYFDGFIEIDSVVVGDTYAYASDTIEIVKDFAKYYYYQYQEDSASAANYLTLAQEGLKTLWRDFIETELPEHVEEQ